MKILIGICGFGNGHSVRQAGVVASLLRRNHQLALLAFDNSLLLFRRYFPQLSIFEVKVPIIHVASGMGVDFGRTAAEPANLFADGHAMNYAAMQKAYDYFGGPPDLVISDYELVAAQYAYALGVPLITVDQQSKFAGFEFPNVKGYARIEEKSRLRMFFPHAEGRFACSFFQIPWAADPTFPVRVIPPILRDEVAAFSPEALKETSGEILVYFSPHGRLAQSPEELYQVLSEYPDKRFRVFSRTPEADFANVSFHPFESVAFLEALSTCEAVITTGGHTLLTEIAYFKKPALVMPLPTFDQQCCAYMIEHNGIGMFSEHLTRTILQDFFSQLPDYRQKFLQANQLTTRFDGANQLIEEINARLDNNL